MEKNRKATDAKLPSMSRDWLVAEVLTLRAAIREHRDSSGHELCWHHPKLWGLLPEQIPPVVAVPPGQNLSAGVSNIVNPWTSSFRQRLSMTRRRKLCLTTFGDGKRWL